MQPKTKLHHRIVALSKSLPRITKEQENWSFRECLPHLGYATKSSAFCLDCGQQFPVSIIQRKRAVCPHCSQSLKIEFTRKTTFHTEAEFAIAHVVDDIQVIEYFKLYAHYRKGAPVRRCVIPVLEDWVFPDGKVQKIGLMHHTAGYCDSWTGSWEIREENKSWYGYYKSGKYSIYPDKYHPASKFKPEYTKIGISTKISGFNFENTVKLLLSNTKAEALLKAKQYSLLGKCFSEGGRISQHWPAIKICMRNRYKIKDASIWLDYVDLLAYFNKDCRNAKYVCPKDLKRQHDRLVEKKRDRERKEEHERLRKRIAEAEVQYAKKIMPFLGLQFTSGAICVKVLETVREFEKEGDLLKHCVFANKYYEKKNSLILSAQINGTPVETIEVSLSRMTIVQARGLRNNQTEHNAEIVSLVKKNLSKIKRIYAAKKEKTA